MPKDDFYALMPASKTVGEYKLIKGKKNPQKDREKDWRFRFDFDDDSTYELDFPTKSWQHKAWKEIREYLPEINKAPFRNVNKTSKRMRHMIQLSVLMKVCITEKSKKSKQTIDSIDPSIGFNRYITGVTAAQIKNIINRMYEIMYFSDDIYKKKWKKGQTCFIIFKAIAVYDDESIDTFTGNPAKMFKELGLSFTKDGKVKL